MDACEVEADKKRRQVKVWKKQQKRLYVLSALTKPEQKARLAFERKIKKLAKRKQVKNGVFFCRAGKPITWERISKYEALCHHMVHKYLPAKCLTEAAFDYSDLINQCRFEVFKALLNKFDPEKALSSRETDPEKKQQIEEHKRANRESALEAAEKYIVYGRLKNYFRRTLYDFHPDQYGGRTVSLDGLLEVVVKDNTAERIFMESQEPEVSSEVLRDKDVLFSYLDVSPEAAKEAFFKLDGVRQKNLLEHLRSCSTSNAWEVLLNEQERVD